MQHTAVNPPAAAARVPLAIVSLYSWPGSRRWAWMSISPGHTTLPGRVDRLRRGSCLEPAAQLGDAAVGDEDVLDCVDAIRGVQHPAVDDEEAHAAALLPVRR